MFCFNIFLICKIILDSYMINHNLPHSVQQLYCPFSFSLFHNTKVVNCDLIVGTELLLIISM